MNLSPVRALSEEAGNRLITTFYINLGVNEQFQGSDHGVLTQQ